jgi:hypothetical protein
MPLFDGFRRKREDREPETAETVADELKEQEELLDGSSTLYRTMDLHIVPAGDDVLLHDPERVAPMVLPAFELELLAQCTFFAPVEEHGAAAANRTGLPADGVVQRLYELVDRGLLVNKHDVMARARAAAEADSNTAPTLDRVAVITASRPESLAACLRSYRERYGATIELVVFDDSADAVTRAENRRVAAEAAAGGPLSYAGEDEKRRFVSELTARSGVEADVVRAAVAEFDGLGWHTGANRNSALLDAAGGAVLMVDDDTSARAAYPADAGDGLKISSRPDPWSLHLFARVEDALDAADWRDVDILAWHRRFLGRSPAACALGSSAREGALPLEESGADLDLNEADGALIAAFSRGRGRVVVTSAGFVGDSGMSPSAYFLWAQGAARGRLLENYEAYRATRGVHRCADVTRISSTQFLMTAHVAFDVSVTIPPFPPVLRNQDGAFSDLMRTSAPEFYTTYLPWAVEHTPPSARSPDFEKALRSVGRMGGNEIIRSLARGYDPAPGVTDPTVRMRALGRYLAAVGAMPAADFDALVRYCIAAGVGRLVEGLTRLVDQNNGEPAQWAEDCGIAISEGMRALTDNPLVVADVPGAAEERQRRFQRVVHRFGRLMDAWPALLEAAKDIRVAERLVL